MMPPSAAAGPIPETNPRPARRPRYPGKNPRAFHQKYKELNSDSYPETVRKVEASGKTAAGTHRPICTQEILGVLSPRPGQIGIDATLGYGGHAERLLQSLNPGGFLLGLDTDGVQLQRATARLRTLGYGPESFEGIQTNFAGIGRLVPARWPGGVDFILADLGCSSMQLDDPLRGFSFKHQGPLDMRMNQNKGPSAAEWLGSVKEDRLARALREHGDVLNAEAMARGLCDARKSAPIRTTTDLKEIVRRLCPMLGGKLRSPKDPVIEPIIRQVFQAVRIAVNDEFSALEMFLRAAAGCLKPGGRLAVLTFHSGEDRRVKAALKRDGARGVYGAVAGDVLRPAAEEIRGNPRASSAKLRWAVKAPSA